jgi:hypothetical protein
MIEIKITVEAALSLLLERMKLECQFRQKAGIIPPGSKLENLSYAELLAIAEASVFDTIFLLPIDLITQENNLVYIISETVKTLSRVLRREEFLLYSHRRAKKVINPIVTFLVRNTNDKNFERN